MSETSERSRPRTAESPFPQLFAGGQTLDRSPRRMGLLAASDPGEGLAVLSARFSRDGYLWLKGLLPRADVLAFRRYVFAAFADTGLLRTGSDPEAGLAGAAEDAERSRGRTAEMVRSAAFESFCLSPSLWRFMDALLGGPSYLHKRKLLRMTKPGQAFSTPAHYDLVYLRGGTDRLVTAWIPIGDTPAVMGGLCYLKGSDAEGRQLEAKFAAENADMAPEERINAYNRNMGEGGWISKDLPAMAERFDSRWLIADYEAGDVVLHSPYMIHAATGNDDPQGRIRLSCDIRYQNLRDDIDARWSNDWSPDDKL